MRCCIEPSCSPPLELTRLSARVCQLWAECQPTSTSQSSSATQAASQGRGSTSETPPAGACPLRLPYIHPASCTLPSARGRWADHHRHRIHRCFPQQVDCDWCAGAGERQQRFHHKSQCDAMSSTLSGEIGLEVAFLSLQTPSAQAWSANVI